MIATLAASAAPPAATPTVTPGWVTGLEGGSGSTVGPDGALYVPEPASGEISRVDPKTGAVTTFASCLPPQVIPLGGAMDVAFIGNTAYALVTLVSDPFPPIGVHDDVNGIYRVDGPDSCTVVADIGAFAIANEPEADIFLVTGVQYAMAPYRGGFLVTDGHHNRVYRVTLDGDVSEFITFGNTVPTGLEVHGNTIYMAEAGPVPHKPADGKVVAFSPGSSTAAVVASGAPLLVDVKRGRGGSLFALSQGDFPCADPACAGHARAAEHRSAREGQRRRDIHGARGRAEPANLARDHRYDRVRGHARRRDLEDRQHLGPALRALSDARLGTARRGRAEPSPSFGFDPRSCWQSCQR